MSVESDLAKLREEIKEMKRLHSILEEFAEGVNRTASELNEARKKDIAKLSADVKALSDLVKTKIKK